MLYLYTDTLYLYNLSAYNKLNGRQLELFLCPVLESYCAKFCLTTAAVAHVLALIATAFFEFFVRKFPILLLL